MNDVFERITDLRREVVQGTKSPEDVAELSSAIRNWVIDHSADELLIAYVPALAATVMLAPWASELFNYGVQELQDELRVIETGLR